MYEYEVQVVYLFFILKNTLSTKMASKRVSGKEREELPEKRIKVTTPESVEGI